MKDSALEQMRQVLPALFEINAKARRPGGLCTPGSGCPPEVPGGGKGIGTDIIGMLTRAADAPPEKAAPDGEPPEARDRDDAAEKSD